MKYEVKNSGKDDIIIFEADTPAGKAFDLALIFFILLSVVLVMLDSIPGIHDHMGVWLLGGEWLITVLFTLEYLLRILVPLLRQEA
ncbi:MAG: hypothetical protein A2X82_09415 [Geobacteraceae bacterium GWC2_55_20]|nr:MAG: hypothetical protein A2X82_09415 [Geobacteraceae bacterium GWC2_55_20]OGU19234.1 MAG: hypothetical protein A2X85_12920 [Geobacteraceae bacterium GWF2_54_21]